MTPRNAERSVRACLAAADHGRASDLALDAYGPELFGFLVAVLADKDASSKVYVDVSQRIRSELPDFRWTCALRTWAYWVARRELDDRRRRRRRDPSNLGPPCDPVVTESRRPTGASLLRNRLREDDREILILRVDRRLDWSELAVTSLGERASPHHLACEARSLRNRMAKILREIQQAVSRDSPPPQR
jgi:RNA polymerase sigma-70 factor (ECF subfamily)